MTIKRLFLTLLLCSAAHISVAEAQSITLRDDSVRTATKSLDWTIRLGYGTSGTSVNHNEALAGFSPLGATTSLSHNVTTIGVTKELFSASRISISLSAEYGNESGSDSGQDSLQYEEKQNGNRFGGGLSLNYNMYDIGWKWQPYLGVAFVKQSNSHELKYTKSGSNFVVNNRSEASLLEPSIGLRVFDPSVQLMSFVSIDYIQVIDESKDSEATSNGTAIASFPLNDIKRDPIKLSIGFGFIF